MKFGGTSVANIDKINNVADIVEKEVVNNKLIVVLSAMAGVTNQMQNYIDQVGSNEKLENDLILTSGEVLQSDFCLLFLKKRNINSTALLGWQLPIITDQHHQKAKILNIDKKRVNNF